MDLDSHITNCYQICFCIYQSDFNTHTLIPLFVPVLEATLNETTSSYSYNNVHFLSLAKLDLDLPYPALIVQIVRH